MTLNRRDSQFVGVIRSEKAVVAQVAHVYESATWLPTERDTAVEVVKELENRRVLYNDFELEVLEYVVRSVIDMRQFFHLKLLSTREEGALSAHLRSMRAACRKFLDRTGTNEGNIVVPNPFHGGLENWRFFTALGELRSSIGISLALLMAAYDLSCEPDLARILPADPAQ